MTLSKENKLEQLLYLMKKSPSIMAIPPERREAIQQKYQNADEDQIERGIQMLQEEQEKIAEQNKKSLLKFEENAKKRKQLLEEENKENMSTQKEATELLKSLKPNLVSQNTKKIWTLFFIFSLALIIFYILKNGYGL